MRPRSGWAVSSSILCELIFLCIAFCSITGSGEPATTPAETYQTRYLSCNNQYVCTYSFPISAHPSQVSLFRPCKHLGKYIIFSALSSISLLHRYTYVMGAVRTDERYSINSCKSGCDCVCARRAGSCARVSISAEIRHSDQIPNIARRRIAKEYETSRSVAHVKWQGDGTYTITIQKQSEISAVNNRKKNWRQRQGEEAKGSQIYGSAAARALAIQVHIIHRIKRTNSEIGREKTTGT